MHPALALMSYLALTLAYPLLWFHPKLREGRRERLGHAPPNWQDLPPGPRIWMHGASAGDVLALLPTARHLVDRLGPGHIVASTITNSGFAMAQRWPEIFGRVIWCPWDVPHAVAAVLDRVRPDVLVLEYTELWPNLIRQARRRGIPIILHNGRLSAARRRSYRILFALAGNLLRQFSFLLMRDESEAHQARRLGARPESIRITGNTKFDNLTEQKPSSLQATCATPCLTEAIRLEPHESVWVLGSTHEGEEDRLFGIFVRLRTRLGPFRLVVAPRYPERAERLVALARRHRLSAARRSQVGGSSHATSVPPDVFILDTVGELCDAYALATLVFVGGSFVPRGGQNILEPAACGKPVLFGPFMHNFVDSLQVLLGRGGLQMASWEQLERVSGELLQQPQACRRLGDLGRKQVSAVRGAAERNAHVIAHVVLDLAGAPADHGERHRPL